MYRFLPRLARTVSTCRCSPIFRVDASTSRLPVPSPSLSRANTRRLTSSSSQPPPPTAPRPTTATATPSAASTSTTAIEPPASKRKGPARTPPKNRQLRPLPALPEEEVEEEFLRGRGPGGQVINKSSILVSLLHIPTGIRVKCQETRSREVNRLVGRRLLRDKVDQHVNGEDSRMSMRWERERRKKEARRRKGKRSRAVGEEDGDGEGEDGVDGVEQEKP